MKERGRNPKLHKLLTFSVRKINYLKLEYYYMKGQIGIVRKVRYVIRQTDAEERFLFDTAVTSKTFKHL